DRNRSRADADPSRRGGSSRQARPRRRCLRCLRAAGDHRRVPDLLRCQRPSGACGGGRGGGAPAHPRRASSAPRRAVGGTLGAARLRRDRGARAARGGAGVLLPRAAVARLPVDLAAGCGGHGVPSRGRGV
ncbi:MAG: Ribosomal silencing factor RsfA, partial [uncultured Nocardioidaceae bacterium]